MAEPFYDTLRTKEQLGYSVHCSTRLTHGVLGFAFVVNSGLPSVSCPVCWMLNRVVHCLFTIFQQAM